MNQNESNQSEVPTFTRSITLFETAAELESKQSPLLTGSLIFQSNFQTLKRNAKEPNVTNLLTLASDNVRRDGELLSASRTGSNLEGK